MIFVRVFWVAMVMISLDALLMLAAIGYVVRLLIRPRPQTGSAGIAALLMVAAVLVVALALAAYAPPRTIIVAGMEMLAFGAVLTALGVWGLLSSPRHPDKTGRREVA